MKRTQAVAAQNRGFGMARLAASAFDIHLNERVETWVEPVDTCKMRFNQLNRRNLPVANFLRHNRGGKIVETRHVVLNEESSSLSSVSEPVGETFARDRDAAKSGPRRAFSRRASTANGLNTSASLV